MSIKTFIKQIQSGELDILEHTQKTLEDGEKANDQFNFFITPSTEYALERAKLLKQAIKDGKANNLSLLGLPISVKDNLCTKGIRTTCGSAILSSYIPPFSSTAISKLEEQGAIIIGKTAMDSFGFGTFNTNVGANMPIPKNPLDKERSCGGSSGGAGAATLAIKNAHVAIGESTGGSITAPAAFCNVIGFTPTYGRISRYGLIDYANSLDKIGTLGKTVEDCEIVSKVMFGRDIKDETSLQVSEPKIKPVKQIAIVKEMVENCDEVVKKEFWDFIKKLEKEGIKYKEISLPIIDYATYVYYIIATAEASSNLAKFYGMRYGAQEEIKGSFNEHFTNIRSKYFSSEEKRRIILGTFVRTAGYKEKYYLKATKVRTKIKEEFTKVFKEFDAIVTPAMPILPPKFSDIKKLTPMQNYALDKCTIPPNLIGLPHLSIPIAKSNGLPIAAQLICNHLEENTLFEFGKGVEKIVKK
ncbi:MAG: amidase family protein [Candidatus Micrarchaeota archaeon]